ncbi:UbiX family flavin prenyltransferase [Thermodesulfobacteriota bacterium]
MSLPLVVGISGASGVLYGVETLKILKSLGRETHLVVSRAAEDNIALETDYTLEEVKALADVVHNTEDMTAPLASGSFLTHGMIIVPCTVKTLSAVANSFTYNLLIRAADVNLKERRPLVLMVRETPLHAGHLKLMIKAANLGALILPPMPAFYHKPETIMDLVHQSIGKALDHLKIEHDLFRRWGAK